MLRRIFDPPEQKQQLEQQLAQNEAAMKQQEAGFNQAELRLWNEGWGREFWPTYSKLEAITPPRHLAGGSEFILPWAGKPESLEGIKAACKDFASMLERYKPPQPEIRPTTP